MSAYVPSEPADLAGLAIALAVALLAGYGLTRLRSVPAARASAWALLVFGTAGVERLSAREPAGLRMLAVTSFALLSMKAIVVIEEQERGLERLSPGQWLRFAAGWLGMQPRLFAEQRTEGRAGGAELVGKGLVRIALGATLVLLARLAWTTTHSRLLASAFLLPGLSFVVHFGLCNALAGCWRMRGVACGPLFRAPLRSKSLGEFWSRRWNLAFSEMTVIAVYRPLVGRVGRAPSIMAGFVLSGLLHELAISVPVRAGFGLPLLYFTLHGGLVLLEPVLLRRGWPLHGWWGAAWALAWLVVPLPLLFHPPFLAGVVWPIVGIAPGG